MSTRLLNLNALKNFISLSTIILMIKIHLNITILLSINLHVFWYLIEIYLVFQ